VNQGLSSLQVVSASDTSRQGIQLALVSRHSFILLLLFAVHPASTTWAAEASELWRALKSGDHVVLIRHAYAPGTGDPANFRLGDCSTQRNLDQTGREQAKRIGERFRANGITRAPVFTSQWCRASETAKLLDLGSVEPLPLLNSFFQQGDQRAQTMGIRQWLAKRDLSQPTVLVTHQVNITSLTGVYPASGEMVVARRGDKGGLKVVGTLKVD
jgi:phosphohistidine phosphatase SixA